MKSKPNRGRQLLQTAGKTRQAQAGTLWKIMVIPRNVRHLVMWSTIGVTGRRRAARDGNQTATLFGAPVHAVVRLQFHNFHTAIAPIATEASSAIGINIAASQYTAMLRACASFGMMLNRRCARIPRNSLIPARSVPANK